MDKCTIDETGKIHGRWKVIEQAPPPLHIKKGCSFGAYWLCECQCEKKTRKVLFGGMLRSGDSVSCGCYRDEVAKRLRKPDAPYTNILQRYKYGAKKRNLPFELTLQDVKELVTQNCHYCGTEPKNTDDNLQKHKFCYNGIDRVDNSFGYTRDNCLPCCPHCNTAKMKMSYDEFTEWIIRVYNRIVAPVHVKR